MVAPGQRVWAEAQVRDDNPELPIPFRTVAYGLGTYIGDFPYTGDSPWGHPHGRNKVPNPKIQLDRGGFVYGCECWWYPLSRVAEIMVNRLMPADLEFLDAPWRE